MKSGVSSSTDGCRLVTSTWDTLQLVAGQQLGICELPRGKPQATRKGFGEQSSPLADARGPIGARSFYRSRDRTLLFASKGAASVVECGRRVSKQPTRTTILELK